MGPLSSSRMRRLWAYREAVYDWGPPLVLLAFGQLDVTLQPALGSDFPGPTAFHRAFLVGATVPLFWRRRRPLAVQLSVNAVIAAWVGFLYPGSVQPPLEAFLLILLVAYSSAVHARGRFVWAGAALAATWIPGTIASALRSGENPAGAISSWVLVAAVFGFGLVIRRQRLLAQRLAGYARQLERERDERAALAAALERSRIARELHDVIAHSLSMIVIQAAAERRVIVDPSSATGEVLRTIEEAGRQAMSDMRRLLGILRRSDEDAPQEPQPRLRDLDLLIDHVQAAGLNVDLEVTGEARELSPGVELSAYRIVQESLSNVLKHASGGRARVRIGYENGELELEVSDDGKGAPVVTPGGHGLLGMRERVALYGGNLEAGPRPGGGFRVRAVLPTSGGRG